MTSAVKLMPCFVGEYDSDVNVWLRDCKLVTSTAQLSEDIFLRAMILALDDKSHSCAAQVVLDRKMDRQGFDILIKNRFSNQMNNNITLRFMNAKQALRYEEFTKLLKEATLLHDLNLLQIKLITQLQIARNQSAILRKRQELKSWNDFVGMAEEVAWTSFRDTLNMTSHKYYQKEPRESKNERLFPRTKATTEKMIQH